MESKYILKFNCSAPAIGDVYDFENESYSLKIVINDKDTIMRVRLMKIEPKKDMLLQPTLKYIQQPFIDVSQVLFMNLEDADKFTAYFQEAVKTCREIEEAIRSI